MKNHTVQETGHMLPHDGNMCLVEKIISHDAQTLHCSTLSHLKMDNPLRLNDRLSSIAALEYAGQAIALHRYMVSNNGENPTLPRQGYLAAVREAVFHVPELSDLGDSLDIKVDCEFHQEGKAIYGFKISCQDTLVVSGSLIVAEENKTERKHDITE